MKRPDADTLLATGLILLLVLLTSAATYWQTRQEAEQPPLATFSNRPDGARALRLWLEAAGYTVAAESGATFQPPPDTDLALILEPALPGIEEGEWEVLDEWVASGGTLLLAGEGFGAAFAFTHYGFDVSYEVAREITPAAQTPLLLSPPLAAGDLVQSRPRATLAWQGEGEEADFATVLALAQEPLLVTFGRGEGRVILSTLTYPFSNAGLKLAGNPELVLNLVALAGEPGSTVWFDEWHHGRRGSGGQALAGPTVWVRETPAGRALLYTGGVLFLALLLAGRRFGRPVPLPRSGRRRAPLEHISAVANLKRRAGHRQATLSGYHQQLKRALGRRYRLSSTLADEEYVARLGAYRPDLDQAALLALLRRLRAPDVGEAEMVKLARAVDEWLGETRHASGRQIDNRDGRGRWN